MEEAKPLLSYSDGQASSYIDDHREYDFVDDYHDHHEPIAIRRENRSRLSKLTKFVVSLLCVVLLNFIWVFSAISMQDTLEVYRKPLFLRVIQSCVTFFLVPFVVMSWLWEGSKRRFDVDYYVAQHENSVKRYIISREESKQLKRLAILAPFLGAIYLCQGEFWTLSLDRTTITTNTAVYQCYIVYIAILSFIFLKEKVTIVKIGCCLLCLGGVFCMTYGAPKPTKGGMIKDDLIGILFTIAASMLYSIMQLSFAKFVQPYAVSFKMLFTFNAMIGVFYILCAVPVIALAHVTHLERFEMPTHDIWGFYLVCLVAYQTVLYIGLWTSTPMFISIGCVLVIPLSALSDYLIKKSEIVQLQYIGMALIFCGFVTLTYVVGRDNKDEKPETMRSTRTSIDDTVIDAPRTKSFNNQLTD